MDDMADLYAALGTMLALMALLFVGGVWLGTRLPGRTCDLCGLLTVLLMIWYTCYVWDRPWLARWLPVSSLVVVGNWFPLAAGFLAGLAWRHVPGRIWRKSLFTVSLLGMAAFSLVRPLWGQPPHCVDTWRDGISLQSTVFTCSPACAATLLHSYGIPAHESELAELCLTRHGTSWQGLYRGLKLKTTGTPWDVEIVEARVQDLPGLLQGPMILTVRLDPESKLATMYAREWGWIPGQSHSTVLLGRGQFGEFVIGDPTTGREHWTRRDLSELWQGVAVRLVPRQGHLSQHISRTLNRPGLEPGVSAHAEPVTISHRQTISDAD